MKKGVLTKFSVHDIQAAIDCAIHQSQVCLRNVSFGFFKNIEVDFLSESEAGYLTDWEIKRSREDFLADFRKKHFHDDIRLARLIYVLPDVMAGEWLQAWCKANYKTFKRSFSFRFYTSEGDVCQLCDEYKRVEEGFISRMQPTEFHTSAYITNDMAVDIIANDRMSEFRRSLFIEERVKLYRLALVKNRIAWRALQKHT